MLGLIGWALYLGSGFIQGVQTQAAQDRIRDEAKELGKVTYTGVTGQLYLTETHQKVWRRTVCGDDCLVDKHGNTVINFTKEKRDKKRAELIAPIKAKAEELGITDRDWLYLKDEMDWFEEYNDARIEIETGRKFGVFAVNALKKVGTGNKRDTLAYTFKVQNFNGGWNEYSRKCKIRAGASIGFYRFEINNNMTYEKQARIFENLADQDDWLSKYFLERPCLARTKEISLTDYLYKYRKPLDDVMMDFLLQTGVIESKKVELAYSDSAGCTCAHTYLEDITKINEDKIKELAAEVDKVNKCTQLVGYETVVYTIKEKYGYDNCTHYEGIHHKW